MSTDGHRNLFLRPALDARVWMEHNGNNNSRLVPPSVVPLLYIAHQKGLQDSPIHTTLTWSKKQSGPLILINNCRERGSLDWNGTRGVALM